MESLRRSKGAYVCEPAERRRVLGCILQPVVPGTDERPAVTVFRHAASTAPRQADCGPILHSVARTFRLGKTPTTLL